jgi:hypothetical protein
MDTCLSGQKSRPSWCLHTRLTWFPPCRVQRLVRQRASQSLGASFGHLERWSGRAWRVHVAIEDAAWVQAGLRDVAVRDLEPTTDTFSFHSRQSSRSGYHVHGCSCAKPPLSPACCSRVRKALRVWRGGARLADGLKATREEAILQQQERAFVVDVDKRAFVSSTGVRPA